MLLIGKDGTVNDARIKRAPKSTIERREMKVVRGIIVHQTGAATAESSLDSYRNPSANGAHFLIDKDGTIYQTASIYRQTWHVGKLKARCLVEKRCAPVDVQALMRFDPGRENKREMTKSVPDRFPSNEDSIGIELVGEALPRGSSVPEQKKTYESVTEQQNASLHWLVSELALSLNIQLQEVFRHPDVSRKNPTEASTAKW